MLTRTALLATCLLVPSLAQAIDLNPGDEQTFTATVLDQFGDPMTVQPEVSWNDTAAGGTVDSTTGDSVVYTAGNTPGSYSLVASIAGNISGSSPINIFALDFRKISMSTFADYEWEVLAPESGTTVNPPDAGEQVIQGPSNTDILLGSKRVEDG